MNELFPPLSRETKLIFNRLPGLIDKTFPVPGRFRSQIPSDIAELSRLLTSARNERSGSYLGKPSLLSAYLRYYLPWNIYRLSRLLSSLPLNLKPDDAVNDIGAGPLTLASALWISRPELRKIPLEFRCIDRTSQVLEAGKKLFTALTSLSKEAEACPWKIKTIRGELKRNGTISVEIRGKPAALTSAVNVYNELFWNFSPVDFESLEQFTEKHARLLSALTDSSGYILVVEPGIPRSGEFISMIRSCLSGENRFPLSPCTHSAACPFPGGHAVNNKQPYKSKWCHFAFDTDDAPLELHNLSAASGLPKERAVLSFILSGSKPHVSGPVAHQNSISKIRIISDSFPLDNQKTKSLSEWGRYGCSERGMVLASGTKTIIEKSVSGTLEELSLSPGNIDTKTGALLTYKKH